MKKLFDFIARKVWNEVGANLSEGITSEESLSATYKVVSELVDEQFAEAYITSLLEVKGVKGEEPEVGDDKELDKEKLGMMTQLEKDKQAEKKTQELDEDTWVKNKKSGNVYTVKSPNPETHIKPSKGEVEKAKKDAGDKQKSDDEKSTKGTPVQPFSSKTIKDREARLAKAVEASKSADENTQKRVEILQKQYSKFMNAKTQEERVEAVRELAEYGLIQGHAGGKKVYMSPATGLDAKALTGASGDSITLEMNKVIKESGIAVPMRGSALDRQKADLSGKHNEAGVVAELDPSEENVKDRDSLAERYREVGGDVQESDKQNKLAAQKVTSDIESKYPGGKVTKAMQVGGIGANALKALGIDPKTDPTDMLVEVEDKDGNKHYEKYSLKVYDDPKNITMKNSGTNNAGSTYLGGEAGARVDEFKKELDSKYSWTNDMPVKEQNKQKTAYRQAYLQKYAEEMSEVAKTPEGQEQLMKMWQEVHGCGKNVNTLVTNKRTGDSEVHGPSHYCNPKRPFKVEYDGVKIVVNMGGDNDSAYLQLDLKTEKNNSKKLLFRHRTK
jgi:hypothetical protein